MIAFDRSWSETRYWNIYICLDEQERYRRDAVIGSRPFARYASKKGWKIEAGLENISEGEKDAFFGYYDGEKIWIDYLEKFVERLNKGVSCDIQGTLDNLSTIICGNLLKQSKTLKNP